MQSRAELRWGDTDHQCTNARAIPAEAVSLTGTQAPDTVAGIAVWHWDAPVGGAGSPWTFPAVSRGQL